MKAILILGPLVVGVGLGWVLASLHHDAPPPVDPVLPIAAAPAPTVAPRPVEPAPPELRGHAPRVPPEASPTDAPPAAAVLDEFDEGEIEEWVEFEKGIEEPQDVDARGFTALLTLYALAGRADDFERVVPKALAAEVGASTIVDLLLLMPKGLQPGVADRLQATHPEAGWPVLALAELYVEAASPGQATALLIPLLEENPSSDAAQLLVRADPDRAASILGAMAAAGSLDTDHLGGIGQAFVGANRPDLALAFLQDALQAEPLSHDVLTTLAGVDRGLALAHARGLTESYGDRADVWKWLAQFQLEDGDSEAAFDAYQEAASRELTSDVVYGLMKADPQRAFGAVSEYLEQTSDDEVVGAVAKVAMKSDHPGECLDTLLRAHDMDPSDHEWNTAIVALDPEKAVEVLSRTVRSYGGDSRDEVVGAYGNALLEVGRASEAFEQYLEAFEADPGDWEWHRGLARSDPGRAVPLLEERHASQGDEGSLLGALADAYAGSGQSARALEHYDRALKHGGGTHWYARMALVDPGLARSRLSDHVAANGESADTWGAFGDLHRALGERADAQAAYARAKELAPTTLTWEIRWRQMSE